MRVVKNATSDGKESKYSRAKSQQNRKNKQSIDFGSHSNIEAKSFNDDSLSHVN